MAYPHIQIAIDRIVNQFSNSPKVQALIQAIVAPLETIEDDIDALKNQRWIDTAVGKQLDGCGYIVGELRRGRNDDEYRDAILFRIFVNTSKATPPDMIHGLNYLTKPDDLQYIEQYPATVMMFTDGFNVPTDIQRVMQGLAPAAISDVQILLGYASRPFRFTKSDGAYELFVNDDADYLTIDGADWTLDIPNISATGSTLGGLAATDFEIEGVYFMGLDDGSELVFNDSNSSTMIESGYHLTGVY